MNIYFSKNIKELRLKNNLTQENLADFLGVSFQTVSKWETGIAYPDITLLPDIAAFFKTSIDELLGARDAMNEIEINKIIEGEDLFNVVSVTEKDLYLPTEEVCTKLRSIAALLPYSKALKQQMLDGRMYDRLSDKAYTKKIMSLAGKLI